MKNTFLIKVTFIFIYSANFINACDQAFDKQTIYQEIKIIAQQTTQQTCEKIFNNSDHFSLPTFTKIKEYIPQIVEIHITSQVFDTLTDFNLTEGTGTGFIYDASRGVICTNFHIVSNHARSCLVVKFHNGEFYSASDARILGTSPGENFGDYTFLQIEKIAHQFPQISL